MATMDNRELQELVDVPRERLEVEYKAWLDLNDKETRAKLARHLCALANNGGGFVVFGINDDMTHANPPSGRAGPYDRDTLSGIVDRYLEPTFQVDVYDVPSAITGTTHPVVWVPSHEARPVCSVRGGPERNGKPVGIARATYYTRVPGPKSVPISKSDWWNPIIRRCVLHDRQALLAGLEPLLRSPGRPVAEPDDPLRRWHDAGHRKFLELADSDDEASQLKRAHYQFSYRIAVAGNQRLDMEGLVDELRRMGYEVMRFARSGWPMFHIFDVMELLPRSTTDPDFAEDEFLEGNVMNTDGRGLGLSDLWRVSPAGMATVIRAYQEDRLHQWNANHGLSPGAWLWPFWMAREIAEVIHHARAFAERFEAPETVSFRAEWRGLQGRVLKDPNHPWAERGGGSAKEDGRVVVRVVPAAELAEGWPKLTADMLSSVLRMFDPYRSVSAEQVQAWSRDFRG